MDQKTRDIWGLAWPVMVGTTSHMLLHLIDLYWIGWLGARELAAVAVASSVLMFLWMGTRVANAGGVAIISQAFGRRDEEGLRQGAADTLIVAGTLGLIIFAVVFVLRSPIVAFFHLDGATAGLVLSYLSVVLLGLPLMYIAGGANAYVVGVGETKVMMAVGLAVNAVNLVLDPLLIFGAGPIPAMGVTGAALATLVAASSFAVIILVWQWRRGGVSASALRFRREGLWRVLRIGVPSAVRDMSRPLVAIVMYRFVATFGVDVLAAYGLASRLMGVVIVYIVGLSVSLTTLTGRRIGEGNEAAVSGILRRGALIGLSIHVAVAALLFAAAAPLLRLFTDGAPVIDAGVPIVRIFAVMMFFPLLVRIMGAAFNGSGDTTPIMLSSLSAHWLVQAPLAWCAVAFWGDPLGIWLAIVAARGVEMALLWGYFRTGRWQRSAIGQLA